MRQRLSPFVFSPNPRRIGWFVLHALIVLGGLGLGYVFGETGGSTNHVLLAPLGVLLGLSFAGLAFVAHEALHGAVTNRRHLKYWLGRVGFAPFLVSPRLWIAWHNRVHHGNTNIEGIDPDAYPSIEEYRRNRAARLAVDLGAPRLKKLRGIVTFLVGFSIQSAQMLFFARKRGHLSRKHHRLALAESGATLALWLVVAWLLGPVVFGYLFGLPLLIANAIVMSYITTNHSLNPLVDTNSTLESTLSVTAPRWYEIYSLQFGYHVEHHIFPSMSHVHGPAVRDELLRLTPHAYKSMRLVDALKRVLRSPRIYKERRFLVDPTTGYLEPTLGTDLVTPTPSIPELTADDFDAESTQVRVRNCPGASQPPPGRQLG